MYILITKTKYILMKEMKLISLFSIRKIFNAEHNK